MKEVRKRPQVMVQAQKDFKGYPWYGEIGIFILAFCVAQIAGGILMTPFTVIMMFGDKDYLAAIAAQDAQAISEVTMRIASSPAMSLVSLFSFIFIIFSPCDYRPGISFYTFPDCYSVHHRSNGFVN